MNKFTMWEICKMVTNLGSMAIIRVVRMAYIVSQILVQSIHITITSFRFGRLAENVRRTNEQKQKQTEIRQNYVLQSAVLKAL